MEEKINRLNEIFKVLEKAISNENSQIFEELVSIIQELTLKIEYDKIQKYTLQYDNFNPRTRVVC